MRRTIEYGYWQAAEWLVRTAERSGEVPAELEEGLKAYGLEQADRESRTCETLQRKWALIREKGRAYLRRETTGGVEVRLPLDAEEDAEEGDEEEGPPDYANEGDDEILE